MKNYVYIYGAYSAKRFRKRGVLTGALQRDDIPGVHQTSPHGPLDIQRARVRVHGAHSDVFQWHHIWLDRYAANDGAGGHVLQQRMRLAAHRTVRRDSIQYHHCCRTGDALVLLSPSKI